MKIDGSLMFDPLKIGEMATRLEEMGFDSAYCFEGQCAPRARRCRRRATCR